MLWYCYLTESERDACIGHLLQKLESNELFEDVEEEMLMQYEANGEFDLMAIKVYRHLSF